MKFVVMFEVFLCPAIFEKEERQERECNAASRTCYLYGS